MLRPAKLAADQRNRRGDLEKNFPRDPTDPDWGKQRNAVYRSQEDGQFRRNAELSFTESVQANQLTKDFNQANPEHPMMASGAGTGDIGGVGISVGTIGNLKNSLVDALGHEPIFCLRSEGEEAPFEQAELQQLLRELAKGIFYDEKRPMFSLHFNEKAQLYPILSPEYSHTSVGRIMGMLDYYIKGLLNGGVFT